MARISMSGSGEGNRVLHFDLDRAAASALRLAGARMIHQNVPHDRGRDRKEVAAIPDVYGALTDQANVERAPTRAVGCRVFGFCSLESARRAKARSSS
ncbi:MAG: hypothetical protein QM757_43300 [Paludibaculum sp.]